MVENIEEIRGGLIPFPPLGNVIDIVRRQRGLHAVEPHKSDAHIRRQMGMFRLLNSFDFRCRKSHAWMGPEAYRFMSYLPGAASDRFIRLALLQQLAEAVKVDIW